MIVERSCLRCGRAFAVVPGRPGRRRVWCSQECRRLASEERRAAASDAVVTRIVVREASLDQHTAAVLDSPRACVRVLRQVAEWNSTGRLDEARWDVVAKELGYLQFHLQPRRRR